LIKINKDGYNKSKKENIIFTTSHFRIKRLYREKEKIELSDHNTIAYPLFELGWNHDLKFSVKLYTKKEWASRHFTLFYKNVEKEGIAL